MSHSSPGGIGIDWAESVFGYGPNTLVYQARIIVETLATDHGLRRPKRNEVSIRSTEGASSATVDVRGANRDRRILVDRSSTRENASATHGETGLKRLPAGKSAAD